MRIIGKRLQQAITAEASGTQLAEGARFSESISKLAGCVYMPKGIYRYKSHEEANAHQLECLARGMAVLALGRR
jgi:hypothetical protein